MEGQAKKYLGAVLISLSAFIFWWLVRPAYDQTRQLRQALAERSNILTTRQNIIADIAELNQQFQERAGDINRLAGIIPTQKNTAEIVSALETMAAQSGVRLATVSILEQKGEAGDNTAAKILNLDLTVAGAYLPFLSFIEALERNIRLIDIQTIDATPLAAGAGGEINFRVKANAYYLK